MTEVVAALIWQNDRFLACQRPAHKARGLLWEFVGGKVEAGETREAALARECREELDIEIIVHEVFMELTHEYPDLTVHLTLFNAEISRGIPQRLEHNDVRWLTTSQIDDYDFCPADVEILLKLKQIDSALQARLFALQDLDYRRFHSALMPTVPQDKVIGIRIPVLRKLSKELKASGMADSFISALPHRFYEEDNLHCILLSQIDDYDRTLSALDAFLPHVDNWATCDLISPKAFRSHPSSLPDKIRFWMSSCHTYTIRFGIGMLLKYYLDDAFQPEHIAWVVSVQSDEYYVNMMIAWYFATALAKQYDSVIPYFETPTLAAWTHNKSIQKALESYRISPEHKAYLRTLKIRGRTSV